MSVQLNIDRKFAKAEAALAELATDPFLIGSHRKAVRGLLGSIQGVIMMRRHALLRPVPPRRLAPVVDFRERQLPVGDRDEGGCPDAA
jgi:hypothetical protein